MLVILVSYQETGATLKECKCYSLKKLIVFLKIGFQFTCIMTEATYSFAPVMETSRNVYSVDIVCCPGLSYTEFIVMQNFLQWLLTNDFLNFCNNNIHVKS